MQEANFAEKETQLTNETAETAATQTPENPAENNNSTIDPPAAADTPPADEPLMKEAPTTPDNFCGDLQEAIETSAIGMIDKQEIVEQLRKLVAQEDILSQRSQIESLKLSFYKIIRDETEELKKIFIENGGDELNFSAPEDETLIAFRQLLAEYKQKRTEQQAANDRLKEENHAKRLQLLERLQVIIESQDDFNKRHNEFRDIQKQWKEADPVPHEHARELWQSYQMQCDRFFDLIRINNELREYDFKKNLDAKTLLCEAIERLINEPDVVSAYHQGQNLFEEWRETGPVGRDMREPIWERFKTALHEVNQRFFDHLDQRRGKEEENLQKKIELCETVENIDYSTFKNMREWDAKAQEVMEFQRQWKSIGYVDRKQNTKIYDRFRKACDTFFDKRGEFLGIIKKDRKESLDIKRAIVERAEALKDSTDWKETAQALQQLREEWRQTGRTTRKQDDALWKRLNAACDHFFDRRHDAHSSNNASQQENLERKKLIVSKIQQLDETLPHHEAVTNLKLLIAEYNTIGHVPYKDKGTIQEAFRTAVDAQFDRLNVMQADRRINQFRSSIDEMNDGDTGRGKLHSERDKLMRTYDRMKNELKTYENNLGFFNVSSKSGNALLKEVEHKIERLKNEIALIVKKIEMIDENLD